MQITGVLLLFTLVTFGTQNARTKTLQKCLKNTLKKAQKHTLKKRLKRTRAQV